MRYQRILYVCAVAMITASSALASSDFLTSFETTYPQAAGSRIDTCTLCHTSPPARNSYGAAYRTAGHSFIAIENLDSDGDGFTNLAEIAALTFPGNAADHPAVATTGSLTVTISPAEAVTAGAQWRVGPSGAYQNSGATVTGLATGSQTLQFKPITGWTTPADQTVTIVAGSTTTAGGTYTQILVAVPNVVGLAQAAASTAITGAGLVVGTITQQNSATVPAGSVISQTPAAGTSVSPSSSVALVVSLGPAQVSVPSVVGLTQAAASTAITGAGLVVGTITQQNSATVPAGSVISQTPTAGTSVSPSSSVALVVSLGPAQVLVPNVVGLAQAAASTAITGAGLVVGTITQQNSPTVPAGSVISQTPAAGTSVSQSSSVALVVSLGLAQNTVPNVVGQTQAAATTAITGAGLTVGAITQQYSATVPSGTVISQTPAAGVQVAAGFAIALTVSQGPQPAAVPSVVGLTQAAAGTLITGAGLIVGTVTQQNSATVPAGNVISQTPGAGTSVSPGSAVALVISSGPALVTVPDVVGLAQAAATAAITGAGFTVGTITQQYSATVPSGSVISQTPAGGTSASAGAAVALVVSQASTTATVPNVVGQTRSAADIIIAGTGLVVGTVTQQYSATVPAGSVISQMPLAGTTVNAGTAVALTVSRGQATGSTVSVPDVVGLTQDAATIAINAVGLGVGQILQTPDDTIPAGEVISQDPAAGTKVEPGSAVKLTISSGQESGGCEGLGCEKGNLSFDGFTKWLGDLFLGGLSLITLLIMAQRQL